MADDDSMVFNMRVTRALLEFHNEFKRQYGQGIDIR